MNTVSFKSSLLKALVLSAALAVTGAVAPAFAQKNQPKAEEDWITYKNERFGYQLYYPAAVFAPKAPDEDESANEVDETPDAAASNAAPSDGAATDDVPATGNTAQANPAADDESDEDDEDEDEDEENGDAADAESDDGNTLTLLSKDGKAKIVTFGAVNSDGVTPDEYRKTLLNEFGGYDKLDYQPAGKSWFVLSGYRGETIYYQKVMFSCKNQVVNVFSINFPTAEKPYYERLVEIMEDNFKTGRGTDTPAGC